MPKSLRTAIAADGRSVVYMLERRGIKNIYLTVKDCAAAVRAPIYASDKEIDDFVISKLDWIEKHFGLQQKKAEVSLPIEYRTGETLPYFGGKLTILEKEGRLKAEIAGDILEISVPPLTSIEDRERAVKRCLAKEFMRELDRSVEREMAVSGLLIKPKLEARNMVTKWGSCSYNNNALRINTRLVFCDIKLLDYIVLHELMHFKYPAHDAAFKAGLTRCMPDWKEREKTLKVLSLPKL